VVAVDLDSVPLRLKTSGAGEVTTPVGGPMGVRLFERALDGWPDSDRRALAALMQRFVDELADVPQDGTSNLRQRV
jgi:hypothetical protein